MNDFMKRMARVIQHPEFIPHLQNAGLRAGFLDYGTDIPPLGDEEVFNVLVGYLSNPANIEKLREFDGLLLTGLPDVNFVEVIEDVARLLKSIADITDAISRLFDCCSLGKQELHMLRMRRYL
jgi:hypothetical protein